MPGSEGIRMGNQSYFKTPGQKLIIFLTTVTDSHPHALEPKRLGKLLNVDVERPEELF